MAIVLREPKRKHRGNVAETLPFPIHTEQATGIPLCEATWPSYTGRFDGDSVIVEKLQDISALYTMGCYGKGSLSRGCALLGRVRRKLPPFLKERQWHRHKQWMGLDSPNKVTEETVIELTEKHNNKKSNNANSNHKIDKTLDDNEENITILDDAESECSDIVEVDNSAETKSGKRKLDTSPNTPLKKRNTAVKELKVRNPAAEMPKVRNPAAEEPKLRNPVAEKQIADQSNIEIVDLSSDDEGSCSEQTENGNSNTRKASSPGCSMSTSFPLHCEETEIVVLPDADSEDEDYLTNLKPRLEHEPLHLSQEKLVLSLEEAMFLSYGLGCLRILELTGKELSLLETWQLFQKTQKTFVQRYIAYHYFRSKGWVVKSGLKFGGDFSLYKEGPHLYHSSYIVVVQVFNEDNFSRNTTRDKRPMRWTQLMGLNRLAESTGKEVLLCEVIWPANLQGNIVPSPTAISSFRVQETLLRRWVASQDRIERTKNREENVDAENSAESACA